MKSIRIAVAGANGRMGRQVIKAIQKNIFNKVILKATLVRPLSEFYGMDAGELIGSGPIGIKLTDNLIDIKEDFDVLIDFTNSQATLEYLKFCVRYKKNMVIGTTGFNEKQKLIIKDAGNYIGIVFSANFSMGINLMLKLLEKTSKIIGKSSDIEIIEAHHRNKKDVPSGTALTMGESIATILGNELSNCAIYNRNNEKRKKDSIGFSTIRAGDIIGEHTVLFASYGERLEITHKASNRMTFAHGAIRASIWINNNEKLGIFNMSHVLKLDNL